MVARTGYPDFLDLPWDRPLVAWDSPRLVDIPAGIHRHVVRFVDYDDVLYVVKELPRRYAEREYRFLRHLADQGVPVVEVVGVVVERLDADDTPLEPALITRHLEFSLPYRLLFQRQDHRGLRDPMLDALVDLLVRIHLVGFFWGDCSLSNTLFRRDAGRLAAYVVDTETGQLTAELSRGQREYDVELAVERCAGELFDLQAAGILSPDVDPAELGDDLRFRYRTLWDELTREEVFSPDERYRIDQRLRRINELGFDVEEMELTGEEEAQRLKLRTVVVEPGRERRRLRQLTGLDVQDNQARRLLNDMGAYRAWIERRDGRTYPEQVAAYKWLDEVFEPTVSLVPSDLRGRREPPELFHEILEHWYFMSTVEGRDMDLQAAARSYIDTVLTFVPEERAVVDVDQDPLQEP